VGPLPKAPKPKQKKKIVPTFVGPLPKAPKPKQKKKNKKKMGTKGQQNTLKKLNDMSKYVNKLGGVGDYPEFAF